MRRGAPLPVLITGTYDACGITNAMNAAWDIGRMFAD